MGRRLNQDLLFYLAIYRHDLVLVSSLTTTTTMPRNRKIDQAEDSMATKRPRRARTSRSVCESMTEWPLDILLEVDVAIIFAHVRINQEPTQIFKCCMPMDLLSLSRTTKVFRQFLMARSAAPLWKIARLNVEGLPERPAHLSEPAYANLAFDAHCNVRFHDSGLRHSYASLVLLQTECQDRLLGPRCQILPRMPE